MDLRTWKVAKVATVAIVAIVALVATVSVGGGPVRAAPAVCGADAVERVALTATMPEHVIRLGRTNSGTRTWEVEFTVGSDVRAG